MRASRKKNVAPFIAGVVILATYGLFAYLIIWGTKLEEKYAILIIQGLIAVLMLVIGYYFGSSESSRSKDEAIIHSFPPGRTCCRDDHDHEGVPGVKRAIAHKKVNPEGE